MQFNVLRVSGKQTEAFDITQSGMPDFIHAVERKCPAFANMVSMWPTGSASVPLPHQQA